ncbi:MAG: PAS domain S-box protein, partial [Ferruginibacter sp.]
MHTGKLRILHLEDLHSDVFLIGNALKKGGIVYESLVVDTKDKFIKALEEFGPDLILADHALPSFNSTEALAIFQQTGLKIPFILLTSTMSDEFAVNVISKGASDYILKDRLNRLPSAIENSLEKLRLEKERQVHFTNLVNAEKRFRALVENSTDAVVILGAAGKPTYVSPSVERMLGYTEEEIKQLDILTLAHPDDIPALAIVMERVLANPGIAIKGHTGRMLHKNGSWRWLEATVTNFLHDPAINGIVDNFRDITVSRLEQEKLVTNENRFRGLIENCADGMAILSAEGKPLYVSPSLKNVLGYSAEEGMQLDLLSLSHPEDIHTLVAIMQEAIAKPGEPVKGQAVRMRHKEGSWRWVDGVITNMLHDPSIGGFVDNFRDVTGRKFAEEKIIHANRLYAFISHINQAIVHIRDENTLFKEACNIAITIGKFKAAWIGIFDLEKKEINLTESGGMPDSDLSRFKNASYENGGPQYEVLQKNNYWLCNDIKNDFKSTIGKQLAIDPGICAAMVLPIKKAGRIIGTFNFYAAETDFFTLTEITLLEEASTDISFALDIFEKEKLKKQADERLAASELRLKQEQAIAHLGSWELSYANGIAIWSDEQLRIYGLSPENREQTFKSWISFIHPEDLAHVLKATDRTKSGFKNSDFFHRIIRRDGSIRQLYSQTRVRFDSESNPVGLYGVAQDVTDTKNAEQALRESESNLQAIFESTSEGFILTDRNGIIKSFNNKSREITYLNTGQEILVGSSIYDYIHLARKNVYKDSIARLLNGETLRYDYPYTRKNGDVKWFDYK